MGDCRILSRALVFGLVDQVYWLRYWQEPNYLVIWPSLTALAGLLYLTSTRPTDSSASGIEWWSMFAVFTAFLAFYAVTGVINHSPYDAHVRQAIAFLHGRVDIERSPIIEQVSVAGRYYQLHPPLPAILLMPFAAIWGIGY